MKILIIEDDVRISDLVKRGLEEHGFSVTTANDGFSGRKLALENEFNLIITDIILHDYSGIDICRELKRYKPDIPVIMLTALGTTDEKVEGFDAGADDYLVKPFEMRELLARIRSLLKRYGNSRTENFRFLSYADVEMDLNAKTVKRSGVLIHLTPKEFNLLEFFLRNPERVLSRTEIAGKVWDTHFDTGTNFIDVYINYLRKKLDKGFPVRLIHTRPGMGFILKRENEDQN